MSLKVFTLPQALKSAGYATGIFGKWHLGDEEPYQPDQRGFDEEFIHGGIGQTYPGSCGDAPKNTYFDPVIRHNSTFERTKGLCTDVFFDRALPWIDARRKTNEPFFCHLTSNAPHSPYTAPAKWTMRSTVNSSATRAPQRFAGGARTKQSGRPFRDARRLTRTVSALRA